MKLAIVGSTGYIAGYLTEIFLKEKESVEIIKIGRNKKADCLLDLACVERFDYSALERVEYVIFTAAISSPDRCAEDYEASWKVNVEGTCSFIRQVMDMGCKVLFFSSDAVYGDTPGQIYTEDIETNAETSYGKMKKAVEDKFCNDLRFKALRLSYVVSSKDKFVSYCLGCIQRNETAEIFHPLYRNCITLREVGNIVTWVLDNWDSFPHTFLNAAGAELVSRVRIADEINRLVKGRLKYRIICPGQSFYLNRPQITQMESIYISRYRIFEKTSFTQSFQREMEGNLNEQGYKIC